MGSEHLYDALYYGNAQRNRLGPARRVRESAARVLGFRPRVRRCPLLLAALFALSTLCGPAVAEGNPVEELKLDRLTIRQQYGAFVDFGLSDGKFVRVEDRAGAYWPTIAADENGLFYVGSKVISAQTGRVVVDMRQPGLLMLGSHYAVAPTKSGDALRVLRQGGECTLDLDSLGLGDSDESAGELLKNTTLRFVDSSGPLLGLVTFVADKPADTHYEVAKIAGDSCRVLSSTKLGNRDNLVELGWSPKGAWWIVGSTENPLLRSKDGEHWSTMKLPSNISEVVSAYVSDDKEIWLAALDSRLPIDQGPQIVHSDDGGKTWAALTWDDEALKNRIPSYWLEGRMRAFGRELN